MTATAHHGFRRLARPLWCVVGLALLALSLLPHEAKAWWNGDWSYRKKITVDAGPNGLGLEADAGKVPLLIRLHSGNFDFTNVADGGLDIRFVDGDDKTALKYHVDTFDGLLGIALVWVEIPDLASGKTHDIYLYFGNQKATQGADSAGTYDPDTLLVYHFGEKNAPARDETAYHNNSETAVNSIDDGIIGRAAQLSGTPASIPASPSLAIPAGGAFTWSAWIKPDPSQAAGVIYSRREGASALVIGIDGNAPYVSVANGGAPAQSAPGAALTPGWHHVAVAASDHIDLYVDGKPYASLAATLPALSGPAGLGGDLVAAAPAPAPAAAPAPAPAPAPAGKKPTAITPPAPPAAPVAPVVAAAPGFVGAIDELQMSKVARSAAYIAAAFATQGPESKAVAYGQDEENAGWSAGYFGVILRSVTIDGWVVIGILGAMAAISWTVMITKGLYLHQVNRANQRFLEIFDRIGADAKRLEAHFKTIDAKFVDRSPLYRICVACTSEWLRRMNGDSIPTSLSAEAIESIRASLDRVAVYENQRLNSSMVLLTIAISGGPFLGLLGTVVGVMITFAAIAATGDVNINAIAPGIAAALVATVAGLGVAIPALFGYNWLITQIKNISSEMQVFIDEFVTKLAEPGRPQPGTQMAAE
jgi:biopolymer transport protein ExbB